jgi:hypothetical protein
VNTQSRERQRKNAQKLGAKNRSRTGMSASTSFKVWDTISQFHPYKNEILRVVKILNSIGANCKIIAAILGLQGWKTFYGNGEWTEEEVQDLLQGFRA